MLADSRVASTLENNNGCRHRLAQASTHRWRDRGPALGQTSQQCQGVPEALACTNIIDDSVIAKES